MDPTPRTYIREQAKRGGALVRRSELFDEVLIQLDSAAGEAERTGPTSVAVMTGRYLSPSSKRSRPQLAGERACGL
jgi:hypothetical protein